MQSVVFRPLTMNYPYFTRRVKLPLLTGVKVFRREAGKNFSGP